MASKKSAAKSGSKTAQLANLHQNKAKALEKSAKAKSKASTPKKKKPLTVPLSLAKSGTPAPAGHNRAGLINEGVIAKFQEWEALDANQKEIGKAKRDIIASLKEEYGITSSVAKHELKLRKLDHDVRVQFETGHSDLKGMLGIQLSLSLSEGEEEEKMLNLADTEEGQGAQTREHEEGLDDADNGGASYHTEYEPEEEPE